MKGLVYTASFDGIAKTAAGDFIEIAAPADAAVVLIGGHLGQSLDFGDAAAEMLRISLAREIGRASCRERVLDHV